MNSIFSAYRLCSRILVIFCFPCFLFSLELLANDQDRRQYSQNTYGGVGLIQTPTARFSSEGEFLFGVSSEVPYNRIFSKMQFLPWMETVLRYTEGTYTPYYSGNSQTWKDKGLDVKFKLYTNYNQQLSLALGINDLGGTGAFASEYLALSKAIDNFDFTLGIGWGRLAGTRDFTNPVGLISDDMKVRGGNSKLGGTLNLSSFFTGSHASIFGGVEYFSPINNLSMKFEYDSSSYDEVLGRERYFYKNGDIFEVDSRVNYALNYSFDIGDRDTIDLSLGYIRGNTVYANFAVHSNLNFSGKPKIILGAEKIRNTNMPGIESFKTLDKNRQNFLFKRTLREMDRVGIATHKVTYNGDEISAEISQGGYQNMQQAIDLASRVLANNSPRNIRKITIINIDNGIETIRSSVRREQLISSVKIGPLESDLIEYNSFTDLSDDQIILENDFLYPNFSWELKPKLNSTIQHQEKFFFWQLEANLHTVYSFKKGLYLTTDLGINLDNNFEDYTFHVPDGELHHVRQDRRLYLLEGESGIRRMAIDYYKDLSPNLKAKISLGYLEWMFGGIGGELLYIPNDKRWALGFDAHWVKQREFDQRFSFQDYETVTGFVNYYQEIPFYEMRLKLSLGKFLGKDIGAMIDISRRFESGARVGGFAALTDCDPNCVGEGSFHKGVYFELPMNLFFVESSTRSRTGYSWSPLTKDAGARLTRIELYELMTDVSDEIEDFHPKSWSVKKIFAGFGTKPKGKT